MVWSTRVQRGGATRPSRRVARWAVLGSLVAGLCQAGSGPAGAAGYYTRKRVNGVWITGTFPKGDEAAPSRGRTRSAARPAPSAAIAAPLPPIPDEEGIVRPWSASRDADEPIATSALAEPRSVLPERDGLDERLSRLKDALQARAEALAAKVGLPISPAPPTALAVGNAVQGAAGPARGLISPPADVPLLPAAGASARPLAPSPPAGQAAPRSAAASLEPKSVSYDFETGIKTTVYESSIVREPFDVSAMKGLGPRPPVR